MMKEKKKTTWKNTINKYSTQSLRYFEPECLEDLRKIIQLADKHGKKVRAVGSGHSFSDIAITDQFMVSLKHLNQQLPLDLIWLKDQSRFRTLVNVEAGITIEQFNKEMEEKELCIPNMGGIDNQTLAGAIATGTHGSGIGLPAIHGMVRSMVLVSEGGNAYRVEPKKGITNPDTYDEEGIILIQDDNKFYSALVSLGCMGIIYSYIVELEPMYWLEERKEYTIWSRVKPKLLNKSLLYKDHPYNRNPHRMVAIQLSPYPLTSGKFKGEYPCIVVKMDKLDGEPIRRSLSQKWRSPSVILGNFRISYWITKLMVRLFPKQIPGIVKNSIRLLWDGTYVDKGYKVLHQGAELIKSKAYDAEYAFRINRKPSDPHYTEVVEELLAKAQYLKEERKLYQSAPIGIRFVKGSKAYLTPECNRDVAYIDTPTLVKGHSSDEILDEYQDIMITGGGIPHWGKISNRIIGKPEIILNNYPKLEQWQETLRFFSPKKMFLNKFIKRLQLDSLPVRELV